MKSVRLSPAFLPAGCGGLVAIHPNATAHSTPAARRHMTILSTAGSVDIARDSPEIKAGCRRRVPACYRPGDHPRDETLDPRRAASADREIRQVLWTCDRGLRYAVAQRPVRRATNRARWSARRQSKYQDS